MKVMSNPKKFMKNYFAASLIPSATLQNGWDTENRAFFSTVGKVTAFGITRRQSIEAVEDRIARIQSLMQTANFKIKYDYDRGVYVAGVGMFLADGVTSEQALEGLAKKVAMEG